jgi:hypothetical protein
VHDFAFGSDHRAAMVFNVRVRRGRITRGAVVLAGLVALAGCGREAAYQYLEVPDGRTFAKVPTGWSIDSEGWVDFQFIDEAQFNAAFVPGDEPIAWRAVINANSDGSVPSGIMSVQSVDVRERSRVRLGPMINPNEGTEETSRVKVEVGDLEGWRAVHEGEIDGENFVAEQLILTDPRRSTVYYLRIICSEQCHDRNREEIDEVLTTFRVEL